jgi:hypothetical protein
MKAKEFMQSVRKAEIELVSLTAKKQHFMDLATSIGVNLTGMPGKQGGGSRVETGAIGLIDLIGECTDKEREYVKLVKKAEELIAKIPNENFRKVLTLRYIACESWKTVRDKMGYEDEKSVYRCNGFALRELQKAM